MAILSKAGGTGNPPQEVKNGQFIQRLDKWTHNTKWVWAPDIKAAVHVSGDVVPITQELTNVVHTTITYEVKYTIIDFTAGTVTVKLGSGDTGTVISANGSYIVESVFTTDIELSFTPTTDFIGYVTGVSVRKLKVQP